MPQRRPSATASSPPMADAMPVASPALFLPAVCPPPVVEAAPRQPPPRPSKHGPAVTKRKQPKSRNGCITCKAKRLKCDETKPTCQQCARRSVACGGYKKDFKWRPFEETAFAARAPARPKKTVRLQGPMASARAPARPAINTVQDHHTHHLVPSLDPFPPSYCPPPHPVHHGLSSATLLEPGHAISDMYAMPHSAPYTLAPRPESPVGSFVTGYTASANILFGADTVDTRRTKTTAPSSVSSGQSPRLVDLLLPGTDLNAPPEEYLSFREQHEAFYQPTGFTSPPDALMHHIEEIPRDFAPDEDTWLMQLPSPTFSTSSSSSSDSRPFPLFIQPRFPMSSPEMLTQRFDRETCGILSVKDGPTENPWRTLIWPLARDCPALYHAIASMTSFHQSRDTPALRIQGIDHMHNAVQALSSTLAHMRVDAAISTTIALAFSESWDRHISTGINHIKGARVLIATALMQHKQSPKRGEDYTRLKFLCGSWIYIDVIARLTSTDDDESELYDAILESFNMGSEDDAQLDPLMGCASTLFPIIGRVANLVKKVRRTDSKSPAVVLQAMELKRQIEDWMPPSFIEDPEDETTSPNQAIRTATAYQYATLLYLHQAVPELPSLPSLTLAKDVIREIATVDISSRSTIVHIYPLMAAGCEVVKEVDRAWVRDRWTMMGSRMKLGTIEKCLQVTKEVWNRRDAYAAESMLSDSEWNVGLAPTNPLLKRNSSSFSEDFEADGDFGWSEFGAPPAKRRATVSGTGVWDMSDLVPVESEMVGGTQRSDARCAGNMEYEFTVNGRLHWLGVMKDWNWEVLLG